MSGIEIYVTPFCPYCRRALALLRSKRVAARVIDVFRHPERRQEMEGRAAGRTSVPQIFIDGKHVGGCDELYQLERRGCLDSLLAGHLASTEAELVDWTHEQIPIRSLPSIPWVPFTSLGRWALRTLRLKQKLD
jgi:glutaredoxin 3